MQITNDDNREISAQIVKKFGQTLLPNGRTLREQLTIEGVSLWDVMTPSMALYYVPSALSNGDKSNSFFKHVRPYVTYTKHLFINNIIRIRNRMFKNEGVIQDSPFMFMGFNKYMYDDVLAPLAKQLACAHGKKNIVLTNGVQSENIHLHSKNIQFESTEKYWDKELSTEARIFKNKTNISISEIKEILKLNNFNFFSDYSQNIISNAFHWLLCFDLPLLADQVVLARKIIRQCKPPLLISSDVADIRSRVFTLLAKQDNIPTLEIQYGSCGKKDSYEWQFLLGDHIAVWGEKSWENLLSNGVSSQQMTITGTARNDSLVNTDAGNIKKIKSQLCITNDPIVVLFASSYQQKEYNFFSDPELNSSMKKAIFNAANKVEGLTLLVKPHPLEDLKETRSFLTSNKNIIFTSSTQDIRDLIKVCDIFIGLGTTATIDAMIAEKLIICPVFGDWIWSDWLVQSNATLVLRSEKEIEETFRNIIEHSVHKFKDRLRADQAKFLNNTVHKPDGLSGKRIARLAISLVDINKGY